MKTNEIQINNKRIMFLDIEWQHGRFTKDNTTLVLEVGARIISEKGKVRDFFSLVKPYRIVTGRTLDFLRLSVPALCGAKTLKNVMKEFKEFAAEVDYTVVWTEDTLQILNMIAQHNKVQLTGKYIILQPIMNAAFGGNKNLSLERALFALMPEYDPAKAHNALYDAQCLGELYIAIQNCYERSFNGRYYVCTSRGKKVHTMDCSYVQKKEIENMLLTCEEAFARGQFCSRCFPVEPLTADWKNIASKMSHCESVRRLIRRPLKDNQIMEIADFFGVSCRKILDFYEITSDYSRWHIYYDGVKVTALTHENYTGASVGFHNHESFPPDIFSTIEYIARHEETPHKRSRVKDAEKNYKRQERKKKLQKHRRQMDEY